uniref:Uncharacterized protein n=1 Tax=Mus musculus TaxID=10090 RepID=Q8C3Q2_MOUSE|nr:unnamed protein product [Mus musculus]
MYLCDYCGYHLETYVCPFQTMKKKILPPPCGELLCANRLTLCVSLSKSFRNRESGHELWAEINSLPISHINRFLLSLRVWVEIKSCVPDSVSTTGPHPHPQPPGQVRTWPNPTFKFSWCL